MHVGVCFKYVNTVDIVVHIKNLGNKNIYHLETNITGSEYCH